MKRLIYLAMLLASTTALAQTGPITSYCQLGATQANVTNILSTNFQEGVVPSCTVQVYLTGTFTPATIYSNGSSGALSNPFTANPDGSFTFWAATGQGYDAVLSGGVVPIVYPNAKTISALYPANNSGGGAGTVTSVSLTVPSWLSVTGSPITTSGTLAITSVSQSANFFLAAPNGTPGVMTPRAIVAADIPTLNQSTTGNAATATKISTNGTGNQVWGMNSGASAQGWQTLAGSGTVTTSGSPANTNIAEFTAPTVIGPATAAHIVAAIGSTAVANATAAASATSATTTTNVAGGSIGQVPYQSAANTTALLAANSTTADQVLTSTGTGSAGQAPTWKNNPALSAAAMTNFPTLNQNTTGTATGISGSFTANTFLAAPNGSSGAAAFRAIVGADIPTLNQNTTGTAANLSGTQTANFVYAAPNGSNGAASFRALVNADIPSSPGCTTCMSGTPTKVGAACALGGTTTFLGTPIDGRGWIQVATASGTCTASQGIVTINYGGTYATIPECSIKPANAAAAALSSTNAPFIPESSSTTGQFIITSGSVAGGSLATSTTYIWRWSCNL